MENTAKVRAYFAGCNIKPGKAVMQFELDPEHRGALTQLAIMAGTHVTLELTSDQLVIPVDTNSGEVMDDLDDGLSDELDDKPSVFELPPATYEYEGVEDEAA